VADQFSIHSTDGKQYMLTKQASQDGKDLYTIDVSSRQDPLSDKAIWDKAGAEAIKSQTPSSEPSIEDKAVPPGGVNKTAQPQTQAQPQPIAFDPNNVALQRYIQGIVYGSNLQGVYSEANVKRAYIELMRRGYTQEQALAAIEAFNASFSSDVSGGNYGMDKGLRAAVKSRNTALAPRSAGNSAAAPTPIPTPTPIPFKVPGVPNANDMVRDAVFKTPSLQVARSAFTVPAAKGGLNTLPGMPSWSDKVFAKPLAYAKGGYVSKPIKAAVTQWKHGT
jgi:hypothetical protein